METKNSNHKTDQKSNAETKDIFPSFDFDLDDLDIPTDDTVESITDTLRNTSASTGAVSAGIQTQSLQSAIDNFATSLNQSAITRAGIPVQTPSAQYKGFAAEEYFKQTLKINALAKGIPDYKLGIYTKGTLPDGTTLSGIDMETDITIFTRKRPFDTPQRVANYQSKIHDNESLYTNDLANKQYNNVDFVGGSGQGVNDKIRVNVDNKTISSDSITPKDAERLADAMKDQSVPEYDQAAAKHQELNRINLGKAITAGAATGAILSTVKEICYVIKNSDNLPEDQFIKSISNILCGTADGAVRSGAIMGSVQLVSKILGKELAANSLGAVPIMAVANTAVDLAKDLYKCFVTGDIDIDDVLCNSVNNAYSSIASFGGAWIGGQIGGTIAGTTGATVVAGAGQAAATGAAIGSAIGPLGTVIGSIVGGIIVGFGAQAVINTANKDALNAFKESIDKINSNIELNGCGKLYYFADSMSSISEYKLSFKNLLPCYNLISDLKEYNLRKKAIKSIHEQLDASLDSLENTKHEALKNLEEQHNHRLKELNSRFNEQRETMLDDFKQSMNTYMANSYSQYIGLYNVLTCDSKALVADFEKEKLYHNTILESLQYRNKMNMYLNQMLSELMEEPESESLLKPFIQKLMWYMEQDDVLVGRQYLSRDEAKFLTSGGI